MLPTKRQQFEKRQLKYKKALADARSTSPLADTPSEYPSFITYDPIIMKSQAEKCTKTTDLVKQWETVNRYIPAEAMYLIPFNNLKDCFSSSLAAKYLGEEHTQQSHCCYAMSLLASTLAKDLINWMHQCATYVITLSGPQRKALRSYTHNSESFKTIKHNETQKGWVRALTESGFGIYANHTTKEYRTYMPTGLETGWIETSRDPSKPRFKNGAQLTRIARPAGGENIKVPITFPENLEGQKTILDIVMSSPRLTFHAIQTTGESKGVRPYCYVYRGIQNMEDTQVFEDTIYTKADHVSWECSSWTLDRDVALHFVNHKNLPHRGILRLRLTSRIHALNMHCLPFEGMGVASKNLCLQKTWSRRVKQKLTNDIEALKQTQSKIPKTFGFVSKYDDEASEVEVIVQPMILQDLKIVDVFREVNVYEASHVILLKRVSEDATEASFFPYETYDAEDPGTEESWATVGIGEFGQKLATQLKNQAAVKGLMQPDDDLSQHPLVKIIFQTTNTAVQGLSKVFGRSQTTSPPTPTITNHDRNLMWMARANEAKTVPPRRTRSRSPRRASRPN
jgi:hypothetical protein